MLKALNSAGSRLAAALFLAATMSACRSEQPNEGRQVHPGNGADSRPALPITEPPIDRARLLMAVIRAASAHSEGREDSQAQRPLDGKQFELRLRFGCEGQGPGRGDHGWSVDPDGRTLRLRVVPNLSLKDAPVRNVAGERIEAAEGFWLSRPWMLQASCPAVRPVVGPSVAASEQNAADAEEQVVAPASPPTVTRQRIGIAQFFTPDDSRVRRRIDRPFEAVEQLEEGEMVGKQGFNLVLSGRLQALAGGRVILCSGSGRDQPPDCVVSAHVDRVWIERPDTKAVIAEWTI